MQNIINNAEIFINYVFCAIFHLKSYVAFYVLIQYVYKIMKNIFFGSAKICAICCFNCNVLEIWNIWLEISKQIFTSCVPWKSCFGASFEFPESRPYIPTENNEEINLTEINQWIEKWLRQAALNGQNVALIPNAQGTANSFFETPLTKHD